MGQLSSELHVTSDILEQCSMYQNANDGKRRQIYFLHVDASKNCGVKDPEGSLCTKAGPQIVLQQVKEGLVLWNFGIHNINGSQDVAKGERS